MIPNVLALPAIHTRKFKEANLMNIVLNGEKTAVKEGTSISALLELYSLKENTTVAEINRSVVKRENFSKTMLKEGDRVELVRFVGGG